MSVSAPEFPEVDDEIPGVNNKQITGVEDEQTAGVDEDVQTTGVNDTDNGANTGMIHRPQHRKE